MHLVALQHKDVGERNSLLKIFADNMVTTKGNNVCDKNQAKTMPVESENNNQKQLLKLCDERLKRVLNRRVRRATERVEKQFAKRKSEYYNMARMEKLVAQQFQEPDRASNGKISKHVKAEGGVFSMPHEFNSTAQSVRNLSEELREKLKSLYGGAVNAATSTVTNIALSMALYSKSSSVSAAAFLGVELIRMILNNLPSASEFIYKRFVSVIEFLSQFLNHRPVQVSEDGGPPDTAYSAEAGDPDRQAKTAITTVGDLCVWLLTGSDASDDKVFSRKLNHYGNLFKNVTFISNGVAKLSQLMLWFFNDFAPSIFTRVCAMWTLKSINVPVQDEEVVLSEFVSDVMEYCVFDASRFVDKEYTDKLSSLHQKASWLSTSIVGKKIKLTPQQTSTVNSAITTMLKFYSTHQILIRHKITGYRPTPFSVQLCGPPAGGKSTVATALAKRIMAKELSVKEYPDNSIYALSACKHWDNYFGQQCVVIDDIAQQKGAPGGDESDAMQFIRLISNVSFVTPQADVKAKGLPFTGDLVISTTNTAFPELKELREADAFYRRRHLFRLENVNDLWKEDFIRDGLDIFAEEESCYAFFPITNTLVASEWTSLDNEIKQKPITRDTIDFYREKYNMMCWPEFVRCVSRRFNKHLTKPDPNFSTRKPVEEEFRLFKSENLLTRGPVRAEGIVYTFPKTQEADNSGNEVEEEDDGKVTFECDGITTCCVPVDTMFDEQEYVGPFVRYCFATKYAYFYGAVLGDRPRLYCIDTRGYIPDRFVPAMRSLEDYMGEAYNAPIVAGDEHKQRKFHAHGFCDVCERRRRLNWSEYDTCEIDEVFFDPNVRMFHMQIPEPVQQDFFLHNEIDIEDDDNAEQNNNNDAVPAIDDDWNAEAGVFDNMFDFANRMAGYLQVTVVELIELVSNLPEYLWYIIGGCVCLGAVASTYHLLSSLFAPTDEKPEAMCEIVLSVPKAIKDDVACFAEAAVTEAKLVTAIAEKARLEKKSCSYVRAKIEESFGAEAGHAYDANTREKPRMKMNLSNKTVNKLVAEAYVSQNNASEVGVKVARGNLVFCHLELPDGQGFGCRGLGLYGRKLLVPGHIVRQAQLVPELNTTIWLRGTKYENIEVDWTDVVLMEDYDLCVVDLPKKFPMFSDIMKHVQTLEEENTSIDRYEYFAYNAKTNVEIREKSSGHMIEELQYMFDGVQTELTCRVLNGYQLPIHYGVGFCGSFIINVATGKLCGFHVAGNSKDKLTLFAPLVKEMFEQLKPEIISDDTRAEAQVILTGATSKVMQQTGVVELIGTLPIDYHQQPPNMNKWAPTMCNRPDYKMFEVKKEPSVMTLSDSRVDPEVRAAGRTPLQMGLDKSAIQAREFDRKVIDLAVSAVDLKLSRMPTGKLGKRLLTDDEIINGVCGQTGEGRFYDGMDMKTSPGLPYRHLAAKTGLSGKLAYFKERELVGPSGEKMYDIRDEFNGIETGSYLKRMYDKAEKQLLNGEVPFYVNAMNLKMETLKTSKIKSASTRCFECLPIHMTMLVRKYFGAFFESLQVNCSQYPVSVGIAAQNGDWTRLARRLNRFGGQVIAGDYVKWDGLLMPCVMHAAIRVVNKWYGDDDSSPVGRARIALAESHAHGYVSAVNVLFRRHGGMPSGSPMTSPINSICNWINILCAITVTMESKGYTVCREKLNTNVELAVYGDDHVVALGPEFLGKVTFRDFYALFNKLGLGYSDSMKTGEVDFDYEHLTETTYLKRKFVPYRSYYLAPLDITSIENMPLWWEKKNNCREIDIIHEKKESFVEELGMHTREVYQEHVNKWNECIKRLKDIGSLTQEESLLPFIDSTHEFVQGKIVSTITDTI